MSTLPNTRHLPKKSFAQVAAAARNPGVSKGKVINNQITYDRSSIPPGESGFKATPDIDHNRRETSIESIAEAQNEVVGSVPPLSATDLSGALQAVTLEDGQTLANSSDNSGKRDNSDTKSVTSRTTLTLDEKESLRPDDSASTRAPLEEDAVSPGGSAVAGSKPGSDREDRAFRDQLNEIDKTGTNIIFAQRSVPGRDEVKILPGDGNVQTPPDSNPQPQDLGLTAQGPPSGLVVPPDEKLIEALASPKDRLFVLKVEQDMIDFIKDSKEQYLQLPQTNSFYRMLSHKLADYYFLGHYIDDSLTSVRIHRTPYARLPPPLIGLDSIANGTTPPPSGPARKIMKRADTGNQSRNGQETGMSSPMPSKPSSENGMGSGSEDVRDATGQSVDKATLSREERENRYNEARARIFAGFKEQAEIADGSSIPNDVEMSRSSSASGIAKRNKKNRKQNDDGFEARSAYSQYNGQAFPITGMLQAQSHQQGFNAFPSAEASALLPFPYDFQDNHSSFQQMPNNWAQAVQYPYGVSPGYNGMQPNYGDRNVISPGAYQQYQNFQAPNMPSQMAQNGQMYNTHPDQNYWGQPGFQAPFTLNGTNAMPMQPDGQFMYPFAGYDAQNPSAYNHQQFNPMSQAFTPSLRGGGHPPGTPRFVPSPSRQPLHSSFQRSASNTPQMSGHNSPALNKTHTNNNNSSHSPRTPSQSQSLRTPNSISKWGTPPTLPPKPPPTATSLAFQAPRHNDSQQPLPQNPMAGTGLQRGQSNGTGRSQNQR